MRKTFYTEAAYALGIAILALGTALMSIGDFGMSVAVAPAYVLYLKMSEIWPSFSFGMAEYLLQGVLLAALSLTLRKFRIKYLLSFGTALLYGVLLDGFVLMTGWIPADSFSVRLICYVAGELACVAGIALLIHTHYPPAVYELIIKELSARYGWSIGRVKTVYDCVSCLAAVSLSLAFFGMLQGVGVGTVVCALINGWLISRFSGFLDKRFRFADRLAIAALKRS